jgi:catalase
LTTTIRRILKGAALTLALGTAISAGAENLTTDAGAPVGDNQNSQTAGPSGPVLLEDSHLIEKLQHFDRERIPERVVHARGTGAFGVFQPTADVSDLTRAVVFSQGTQTPVFVRFSTVMGYRGSPEQARDPRGFAVKFYTKQGNWDMAHLLHSGCHQIPRFRACQQARCGDRCAERGPGVRLLRACPGIDQHADSSVYG